MIYREKDFCNDQTLIFLEIQLFDLEAQLGSGREGSNLDVGWMIYLLDVSLENNFLNVPKLAFWYATALRRDIDTPF